MDTLYVKEEEIAQLVTVAETIDVLEALFRDQAANKAINNPRDRLRMPGGTLHLMAGAIPGYFGYKMYTSSAAKLQFLFLRTDYHKRFVRGCRAKRKKREALQLMQLHARDRMWKEVADRKN